LFVEEMLGILRFGLLTCAGRDGAIHLLWVTSQMRG